MTKYLFSRRARSFGLGGVIMLLLGGVVASPALAASVTIPASLSSTTDASTCTNSSLTQPFLASNDSNWYTLVPGESPDNFDGGGWTLEGGAMLQSTQLADGQTGSVLNLPSGSQAISPAICVNADYPTARTYVRNVVGAEGVQFYVSYQGTNTWLNPRNTGQFHGQQTSWTVSDPINLQPPNSSGWQIVRFVLVPGGNSSDFQVYDFYVDPRMH